MALGSSGPADIDDSAAGILMRRCARTGRGYATVWSESGCLTLPVPAACLKGAHFCMGAERTLWPSFKHRATLDLNTTVAVYERFSHGPMHARFALGTLYALEPSCMPVAMTEATGPSTAPGGAKGLLGALLSAATSEGAAQSPEQAEATLAAIASLGFAPTDLSWASFVFANASAARPDAAAFRAPKRCRASLPEGAELDA